MANLQVGVAGNGTVTVGAGASVHSPASNTLTLGTNGDERVRIDSNGKTLVGHSASRAVGNITSQMQLEGTDASTGISICRNSNNAASPYISLAKSRAGAVGGNTIIQDDDKVGEILFSGADGTDITNNAASIATYIDGTPGGNDTPGRLTFNTTADGGTSPTERMRIRSDGIAQFTNAGESLFGTGVTAMNIGNGMNVSMADDASFTMSSACNTGGLIAVGTSKDSSGNLRYRHGLFFAQYGSSSVTELSDLENTFATSDSDGYVCVYATGNTNGDIVIKNRLGHTSNICVTIIRILGN